MAGPPTCPWQWTRTAAWAASRTSMSTKAASSVPSALLRTTSIGSSPVASSVITSSLLRRKQRHAAGTRRPLQGGEMRGFLHGRLADRAASESLHVRGPGVRVEMDAPRQICPQVPAEPENEFGREELLDESDVLGGHAVGLRAEGEHMTAAEDLRLQAAPVPTALLHGPDEQLHGVNAESRGFGRPIAVAGRREKKVIHPPQPQNRIEQADGDARSHDRLDHGGFLGDVNLADVNRDARARGHGAGGRSV